MDTTKTTVKKRVNDKKGGKKAPAATVTKVEPCDSFFNFFRRARREHHLERGQGGREGWLGGANHLAKGLGLR